MEQTFLIIWGMHRSGTSLLSRAMQVFGAAHTDSQLVIHSDNPTGYWEDRALVALDSAMLDALGMAWDSLERLEPSHVASLEKQGFLAKALEFLRSGSAPLVALKDPRMTKLGPFWERVFASVHMRPLSVVAYRNPLSVVHSLQRRKGIVQGDNIAKRSHCYELWWHYTTQALAATVAYPRVCVEYDLFLQHPEDMLLRMGEILNLSVNKVAMASFVTAFLNTNHRHNHHSISDVLADRECPQHVFALYRDLYERAGQMEGVPVSI